MQQLDNDSVVIAVLRCIDAATLYSFNGEPVFDTSKIGDLTYYLLGREDSLELDSLPSGVTLMPRGTLFDNF